MGMVYAAARRRSGAAGCVARKLLRGLLGHHSGRWMRTRRRLFQAGSHRHIENMCGLYCTPLGNTTLRAAHMEREASVSVRTTQAALSWGPLLRGPVSAPANITKVLIEKTGSSGLRGFGQSSAHSATYLYTSMLSVCTRAFCPPIRDHIGMEAFSRDAASNSTRGSHVFIRSSVLCQAGCLSAYQVRGCTGSRSMYVLGDAQHNPCCCPTCQPKSNPSARVGWMVPGWAPQSSSQMHPVALVPPP